VTDAQIEKTNEMVRFLRERWPVPPGAETLCEQVGKFAAANFRDAGAAILALIVPDPVTNRPAEKAMAFAVGDYPFPSDSPSEVLVTGLLVNVAEWVAVHEPTAISGVLSFCTSVDAGGKMHGMFASFAVWPAGTGLQF